MNDLRKAAEMALEALEAHADIGIKSDKAVEALRQALAHEALDEMVAENQRLGLYDDGPAVKSYAGGKPNYCTPEETPEVTPEVTGEVTREVPCKTDPRAPHGFNRNASFDEDRYVCDCEFWEPPEETFILDRGCYERGCVAYDERDGDGVYMSEKRVQKTDKSIHEPLYMDMNQVPTGMPDWKPGMVFPAPKRDSSSWVGLTHREMQELMAIRFIDDAVLATEAKLKEKNT
jgi:hypothetical protein